MTDLGDAASAPPAPEGTASGRGEKGIELSFSRIQAHLRCPVLHQLTFELGWRTGPTPGTALGLSLHRALAEFMAPSNTDRSVERLWEYYDAAWVNEGFATAQETLDTYDRGRHMLERFVEAQRSRPGEVVATEKAFHINRAGFVLRGTVDRLDRDPDGIYTIIEYKTRADHWSPDRLANDLQMTLYHIGIKESVNVPVVRLLHYFLSTGAFVETTRSPEQLEAANRLLEETANRLRAGETKPNLSHCPRCDFRARCPEAAPVPRQTGPAGR